MSFGPRDRARGEPLIELCQQFRIAVREVLVRRVPLGAVLPSGLRERDRIVPVRRAFFRRAFSLTCYVRSTTITRHKREIMIAIFALGICARPKACVNGFNERRDEQCLREI
jgi:hypothetical protein